MVFDLRLKDNFKLFIAGPSGKQITKNQIFFSLSLHLQLHLHFRLHFHLHFHLHILLCISLCLFLLLLHLLHLLF